MSEADPDRVAIVAPLGRDAQVLAGVVADDGLTAEICRDLPALVSAIDRSGLAVLTEEALQSAGLPDLARKLEEQPAWSDYPIVLLTLRGAGVERAPAALRQMQALGNVTFLERPFHPLTLVSVVRTALASRRRQYQARDRLAALEASRELLARSDETLRYALDSGRLGAWEVDLATRTLTVSPIGKAQFGRAADEAFNYDDFQAAVHPEDRESRSVAVQRSIDTGADYEIDYRILTPSGELRWIEIRGRATYESGRAVRMAGVSLDVTARKLLEERQNLLIRELHHRVKNTLSTVQAIVGSTARSAESIDAFYRDFTNRIVSLANTHTILTEEFWQRASLHELLQQELAPYGRDDGRISVAGPRIELPSEYAVPLGMAFHELATNAAKYGALSLDVGRLSVGWALDERRTKPRLQLEWTEMDGPAVQPPSRKGFGSRLLERVLTAQLHAQVDLDFRPTGLAVTIAFDVPDERIGTGPNP